jgi:hypothetical protein
MFDFALPALAQEGDAEVRMPGWRLGADIAGVVADRADFTI